MEKSGDGTNSNLVACSNFLGKKKKKEKIGDYRELGKTNKTFEYDRKGGFGKSCKLAITGSIVELSSGSLEIIGSSPGNELRPSTGESLEESLVESLVESLGE